jgi:hypothetical protein
MNSRISTSSRHISWEQLHVRIQEGIPFVHRIPSPGTAVPAVDIRVSERGEELALWIPCSGAADTVVSPLSEIDIAIVQTAVGQVAEIRTRSSILFQEVYSFFVSIIDKVQLDGVNALVAIEETLDRWKDLLKTRAILSEEAQLGLRGELHFLRRLIPILGNSALDAWTGPQKQPHDFRLGNIEIEVKATQGITHTHIINGLGQLIPSPDHSLYVYSIRLAPAGADAGATLPEDIEATRRAFQPLAQIRLDKILKDRFAYRSEHAGYYSARLQLADKPRLVPVDDSCPRLTSALIASVPHHGRLSDVRYRANLEGLGFSDGSPEFEMFLSNT